MASLISKIKDKVLSYIDTNVSLFKVNMIGKTARLMSYFMFAIVCLAILLCICFFAGFSLTEAFVDAGMSRSVSYLLTTGVYFVVLLIVYLLRWQIVRVFANAVVSVLTEDDDEDPDSNKPEQ